ncbi:histidinol dehydrogenase [Sphingorhabdus lutea]|uniref:Histidinol dehydrogenase n=1 Tax=Sphingorhabdus lutea TaxID=1913578 RepID=A0A1L3JBC1_9SPHN|nr:histidinol dehydrogenase [Sphingorhabdus lutea]APG62430.1 histidinol dehydrogenase [Sphingorhabdus lutea]
MPALLNINDKDFDAKLARLTHRQSENLSDISGDVANIIADVRRDGDKALYYFTQKFDGFTLNDDNLRVSQSEIDDALNKVSDDQLSALKMAANRIAAYHERQRPDDALWVDDDGVTLGWRWGAVDAVGIYVPGGKASYPSSVLMNAIPAKVAGVPRIAMVVPTPNNVMNPLVLAAAHISGVSEIFRIGGAHAVAALAYGTKNITAVDKIVGPGNAFVAEAKRQIFGRVGIDTIAGPSEILVVSDDKNNPSWIAADLLSQSEHDPDAQSIFITDNGDYANHVCRAIEEQLNGHSRADIARTAWENNGSVIIVNKLDEAPQIINKIAPEHLELAVDNPESLMENIRHAGAIFMGRHSPEAIGDYIAGPNHVLPTSGVARFASGLSTLDFMKRTSIIGCNAESLANIGPAADILAQGEGLESHGRSISIRLEQLNESPK